MYERISYLVLPIFLAWVLGSGAWHEMSGPLCSIGIAADAMATKDRETWCFEFWLSRYQTLLTAILALGASVVGVVYLRRQIAQTDQQERDRIARRHAAERANLSLSLSEICRYAQCSAKILKEMLDDRDDHGTPEWARAERHPPVPVNAIAQLQRLIETLSPENANAIADLIGEIQIHNARKESVLSLEDIVERNITEYILDAIEIYARSSNLFDFARRNNESMPSKPSSENMESALSVTGIRFADQEEIRSMIRRRYPRTPEFG